MSIWWLFAFVFLGGPALYYTGLWLGRSRIGGIAVLAVTVVMVALGAGAQTLGGDENTRLLALGAVAFWFSWIGMLVYCALRIRQALPGPGTLRWSRTLGAIGTTVPWFGFVWASMAVG